MKQRVTGMRARLDYEPCNDRYLHPKAVLQPQSGQIVYTGFLLAQHVLYLVISVPATLPCRTCGHFSHAAGLESCRKVLPVMDCSAP